jgi:surfactin synthase thioesterase subunit
MNVRLKCLSPRPMATLRLLCLPFAGAGAATFRGWAERLPAHVEAFAVQLPGREDRLGTPALTRWAPLLDALLAAVDALPVQRTAIFGHSLGAVIGLELARALQRRGTPPLEHLFVSGRPWPGLAAPSLEPIWSADDADLLAAMGRRFGSLDTSLSHPEIRDVVLPALRADLRLLDAHRHAPDAPLRCPLTVFAGTTDPGTDADALAGWRGETTAAFELLDFPGGHFFVESHRAAVVAAVAARLPARDLPAW